jgi:hypothetical protein
MSWGLTMDNIIVAALVIAAIVFVFWLRRQ